METRPTFAQTRSSNEPASSKQSSGSVPSDEIGAAASRLRLLLDEGNSQPNDGLSKHGLMGLSDDVRDESSGAIEISLGDTILRTMTGSATNPEVGPARFAGSGELDDVAQIVGQIADRILVAEPSAGDREVRIVLKDSVLPATEIRLSQAEGKLQLQFVTDSPVAQSILQNNHDALQTRLQGITGKSVAVTIGSDAGGNDASQDQRSRGYRESLGVEEDE